MNLERDDTLRLLAEALTGWLATNLPIERRRTMRDGAAHIACWRSMQQALGLAGAGLPEAWGGFGGGAEAHMVIMEALGAALAVVPYAESAVLVGTLLQCLGLDDLGRALAGGETLIVCAWEEPQSRGHAAAIETRAVPQGAQWRLTGTKRAVRWAAEADMVLATARTDQGPALFRIDAPLPLRPCRLIDDHPAADLDLADTPAQLLATAIGPALDRAVGAATAAICAEAVGLMRTMLDDTIAYTRDRRQFGQPLATFQVLQHRMVDMRMLIEQSAAAALLAALKGDDPAVIAAAKTTVGEAARQVGQQAVQLHGAMGLTEELRVGHYFRRTTAIENQYGDADFHLRRYARLRVA
jgi:alkylation response protein AidB-like acyl-CoA dehydrogenase